MDAAGEAAKKALEAVMRIQGYEYKSEFARTYVQQGREEGLRLAVQHLCAGLGIEWSVDRAAHVETLDAASLMALVDTLSARRAWPDAG